MLHFSLLLPLALAAVGRGPGLRLRVALGAGALPAATFRIVTYPPLASVEGETF